MRKIILHPDCLADIYRLTNAAFAALADYPNNKKGDLIGFKDGDKYCSVYWNKSSIVVRNSE